MKAVRFHELGEPNVLRLEEVADPVAGDRELLVEVFAAGVNFSDAGKRRGLYLEPTPLPYCPGSEVAGIIRAVGKNTDSFGVGDRVVGMLPSRSGGYAEMAVVPMASAAAIPEDMAFEVAVTLPNQGATAQHLLQTMGGFQPGESVLIHAAAGGVGGLAVQLAKLSNAGWIGGLASTETKRAYVMALGADMALDPSDPSWPESVMRATNGNGVDLILDSVGGEAFERSMGVLSRFGRVICYGLASGVPNQISPLRLMRPCQSVAGFHLDAIVADGDRMARDIAHLVAQTKSGLLRPHIGATFPLDQVVDAHRLLESRQLMGKIVVLPRGTTA
jgi:NADPH:quinone reductase